MKWNKSGFRPPLCTYRLNWARRTSWGWWDDLRWHCPPDTRFEIRALAVWGRARYLSVTEAPHYSDFHTWMGKTREYNTDIVFFWKCLYGNYDVDVNDFVSFFSDGGSSIRNYMYIDSGFLMGPSLCRTNCFKRSVFNRIFPMWNSLPFNVRHITNYSSFINIQFKASYVWKNEYKLCQ